MLKSLYLLLFSLTFSLFLVSAVNAQTTFWNLERDTGVTTPNALNMYLTVTGSPQPKAMTILENGNVGIGTTTANRKLTVQNTVNAANAPVLYLKQTNDYGYSFNLDSVTTGRLFIKGVNNGVESDIMALDRGNGNVGIGTTAPGTKLSVAPATAYAAPTLGTPTGAFSMLGDNSQYGLYAGVSNTGNTWLQAMRNDAASTAYAILLNPSGGNIGIGTAAPNAKLDIYNAGANGDGVVMAPDITLDNNFTIQTYIDSLAGGGWTNRTTYAGACCNNLALQPDVGTVSVGGAGGNFGTNKFNVTGNSNFNGNVAITGTFSPTNLTVSGTFTAPGNGGYNINSAGTSRFADIKTKAWNMAGGSSLCLGPLEPLGVGSIGVCSSDVRLKKNIRYFQTPILDQVLKLKPALFDVRDDSRIDVPGFIAQDVQQVFPESVIDKGDGQMLQFSSEQLVPYLTKAIQELSTKIDAQQKEIELLKQNQSQ